MSELVACLSPWLKFCSNTGSLAIRSGDGLVIPASPFTSRSQASPAQLLANLLDRDPADAAAGAQVDPVGGGVIIRRNVAVALVLVVAMHLDAADPCVERDACSHAGR